jgi:hypothetical protein
MQKKRYLEKPSKPNTPTLTEENRECKKRDKKILTNIKKKQERQERARKNAIYASYILPSQPMDFETGEWHSSPLPTDYDLTKYIQQLPMQLTYLTEDQSLFLAPVGEKFLQFFLMEFLPLPLDLSSIVAGYSPCLLAFHLDEEDHKRRNVIYKWMSILLMERKPYDTRWGGLLVGKKCAMSFRHCRTKQNFEWEFYGKEKDNVMYRAAEEWLLGYSYASNLDKIAKVVDNLSSLTGPKKALIKKSDNWSHNISLFVFAEGGLVLVPLLVDRITWSPLRIVYKEKGPSALNLLCE